MPRSDAKIAQDFRDVFERDDAGRRVLAHIMAHCKVYAPIVPGPDKDFDLGARNVALMIASYLAYRPADFVSRAREHMDTLRSDDD